MTLQAHDIQKVNCRRAEKNILSISLFRRDSLKCRILALLPEEKKNRFDYQDYFVDVSAKAAKIHGKLYPNSL